MLNTITFESDKWMLYYLPITNKAILGCNGVKNVVILKLNELTNNTFYVSMIDKEIRTSNEPFIDDEHSFAAKIIIKKRVAKILLPHKNKILFKNVDLCY